MRRVTTLGAMIAVLLASPALAAPTVIVAAGDTSPLGRPFSSFSDVTTDDTGRVAFVGTTSALFRRAGGRIAHVVAAGDTLDGHRVAGTGPPATGTGGCVAFRAFFAAGGEGVYRQCGAAVDAMARAGDTAPGGGRLTTFSGTVAVGTGGQVLFTATVDSGATVLLVAGSQPLAEITRTGSPSPSGGTFTGLRPVGGAADGSVGFRASVSQGRDGLFLWNAGRLSPFVIVGDVSPAGGQFTSVGGASINAGGDWAFRASVSAGSAGGVFRADGSLSVPLVEVVALEGGSTPLGGTFRQFPNSLVPEINAVRTVSFRATVDGDGVLFGSGIFLAPPGAALRKVVAAGEPTAAGQLVRLRDPELAEDGSVLIAASLVGGGSGLFVGRGGTLATFARSGDATDLGVAYRYTTASVGDVAEDAVFAGQRDGVFVGRALGGISQLAALGSPTPLGGTYAGFDPPVTGARGRVVFRADIQDGRSSDALLIASGRGTARVVSAGQGAPGGDKFLDILGTTLDTLTRAAVGARTIAFGSTLSPSGSTTGIFMQAGSRLRQVVRSGDAARGGGRFRGFGTPALGSGSTVAFVASVSGGRADSALFVKRGARLQPVAAIGDTTHARLGGRFAAFDPPAAGPLGVVVRATLDSRAEALFLVSGRRRGTLIGTGDPAPGGGTFTTFSSPVFAGAAIAFLANASRDAVGGGLFRIPVTRVPRLKDPPATVVPVARIGEASPLGGKTLSFGIPSATRRGTIVVTTTIAEGRAVTAIVEYD